MTVVSRLRIALPALISLAFSAAAAWVWFTSPVDPVFGLTAALCSGAAAAGWAAGRREVDPFARWALILVVTSGGLIALLNLLPSPWLSSGSEYVPAMVTYCGTPLMVVASFVAVVQGRGRYL
ncbi:hypothetical protein GEV29_12820 [Aeromicrobium sp. SMF47]|uniref:Uncharacterized protein n=1 Tax=Aeromicrobium yanjiei TaxID=2662028 RepID=A0A5Q2MM44_9ACTN|nr:hypothetical protein [Aeromicrobium yanjiei]MRJ77422.1 hypothetical protein [Aeromicrobium yanjiei]QGG41465.1 hypothetical protein GEV26_08865 [Aeromicrobium yanjiei]